MLEYPVVATRLDAHGSVARAKQALQFQLRGAAVQIQGWRQDTPREAGAYPGGCRIGSCDQ